MRRIAAALLICVAAASCRKAAKADLRETPSPPGAAGLDAFLASACAATGNDGGPIADALFLPRAGWTGLLIPELAAYFDTYALKFYPPAISALVPQLTAACGTPARGTARPHFAGDPALSREQTRLRWTVPPLAQTFVVDGIDTVFVHDAVTWRALAGIDPLITDLISARDPACGADFTAGGGPGRCTELLWMAATAALGNDADRLARACATMHPHCRAEAAP